jgi:hypothetical protein
MAVYRCVLSTWMDTTNPTDAMQVTPHFSVSTPLADEQALCDDLLEGWRTWVAAGFQGTQMRCTVYNAQGAPPHYPLATKEINTGVATASTINRDVAVCLSYYSQVNRPRHRGRLYIPCVLTGSAASGGVVSSTIMTKVAALVPVFTGLGGVDVDWCVYSRVDDTPRSVSNWWIDNSWDTQRRRGRKADARQQGSVSE